MNGTRKRAWIGVRQMLAVVLISVAIGVIDFLTRGVPIAQADVPPPADGGMGGEGACGCGTPTGEGVGAEASCAECTGGSEGGGESSSSSSF